MDLKQDLKALREQLPYGAIQRIADTLGRSRHHIESVFKQRYHDDEVVNLAIKEVQKEKQRKDGISKRIRAALKDVA
jgi:hypothetical protein